MAGKKGLTVQQLAHALTQKNGNVTEAAAALGMSRYGVQKRIAKSAELQQILTDARESLVDMAESVAAAQIMQGNTAIIIFTLKTLGKSRGYVERHEVTGPDDGALIIKVIYGSDGTDSKAK